MDLNFIHPDKSPLANRTVVLKFKPNDRVIVADWWDRLYDKSWTENLNHPAVKVYLERTNALSHAGPVPADEEVLYGRIVGGDRLLFHASEIQRVLHPVAPVQDVPPPELKPLAQPEPLATPRSWTISNTGRGDTLTRQDAALLKEGEIVTVVELTPAVRIALGKLVDAILGT